MKKLVIARLDVLPSNVKISIGDFGEFTKSELIDQVDKGTPIGEKIAEIQMVYIRSTVRR